MPTEEKLAYEITLARNDLEENLADLKDAVADELDVGKQAQRVLDKVKEKAASVADEQWFRLRMFAGQKRRDLETYVRANPEKAALIAGGALVALVGSVLLYRRMR